MSEGIASMASKAEYSEVVAGEVILKIESQHKPNDFRRDVVSIGVVNIIIMVLCLYDMLVSNLLFYGISIVTIILVEVLMWFLLVFAYIFGNDKRALLFTDVGIAISPPKQFGGYQVEKICAQKW